MEGSMKVNADVTIESVGGRGNTILYCNHKAALFEIIHRKKMVIRGITFENCPGGLIFVAIFSIFNCVLRCGEGA